MALIDALAEVNPWWLTSQVPSALRGRSRGLSSPLVEALDLPEVVALTGVRRCGKTTLMYQLAHAAMQHGVEGEGVLFANLEDPGLGEATIEALVSTHRQVFGAGRLRLLLLDEVQARPGWEAWVNALYERKTNVKVVVTGSTSALLHGEMARLLTGRCLTFKVRPLDFGEFLSFHGASPPRLPLAGSEIDEVLRQLDRYLQIGGFPEANLRDEAKRRMLLQEYFQGIIARDLVHHHRLDPQRIERFSLYIASAFARPHTKRSLAEATGISLDAVRDYLNRLEDVFLIQVVRRFTWSPKPSQEERAPIKPYFVDTGMRSAVTPVPSKDRGRSAENLVANVLSGRGPTPAYWTDGKGHHEVDFMQVKPDGTIDAYQVTYGEQVPDREIEALLAMKESLPRKRLGRVMVLTRNIQEEREGIDLVPLWRWLLAGVERPGGGGPFERALGRLSGPTDASRDIDSDYDGD